MSPESRIAVLESQREEDKEVMKEVSGKLDTVIADVQTIRLGMEKQKGFIAGCLFVLVPIWSAIVAGAMAAWDWWQSGGTHQ